MKKKRNEVTVEIRKNKREETLQKRRNVPNVDDTTGNNQVSIYGIVIIQLGVLSNC